MAVDSGSMGKQQKKTSLPPKGKGKGKAAQGKENEPSESEAGVVVVVPVRKRNKSPGVRVIHGRVYDSTNGKTCHQCRQKTTDVTASCKNQRNGKACTIMVCHKCLLNRYGEKTEEVSGLAEWSCPKCRGICNCSFCMKKKGCQPTGILVKTAKASGYSSVSEMLLRGGEQSNPEHANPNTLNLPTKDTSVSPKETEKVNPFDDEAGAVLPNIDSKESKKLVKVTKKRKALETVKGTGVEKVNPFDGEAGAVLPNIDPKESKKLAKVTKKTKALDTVKKTGVEKVNSFDDDEAGAVLPNIDSKESKKLVKVTKKRKALDTVKETAVAVSNEGANAIDSVANELKKARNDVIEKNTKILVTETANNSVFHAEIPLPVGKDLLTVAGTEVQAHDVGNALQFSEFCAVFGEVLHVKKGRAHHVLQDIFHGRTGRIGKISTTVQFLIDMLSILKEEQGERSSELSLSGDSWFRALKECLSESQGVLAAHGMDSLDKLANFETLDASQKLRLLNVLCDEILGTEKIRNWIEEQNEEFAECVKEAKEKLRAVKEEESTLKKQLANDLNAAIVAKNGAPLSIEEHAAIVSRAKPEIDIAHAKVLESKGHIMNYTQYPDAVRAESIIIDQGHAYWKLNISGKGDVLCQQIGKGDYPHTLDEKWSSIDTEEKEVIEKHTLISREKVKAEKRAQLKAIKELKSTKVAASECQPQVGLN